ncbi:hypothetical protein THAOC_16778, partial [Thalassiosira oceanica]
ACLVEPLYDARQAGRVDRKNALLALVSGRGQGALAPSPPSPDPAVESARATLTALLAAGTVETLAECIVGKLLRLTADEVEEWDADPRGGTSATSTSTGRGGTRRAGRRAEAVRVRAASGSGEEGARPGRVVAPRADAEGRRRRNARPGGVLPRPRAVPRHHGPRREPPPRLRGVALVRARSDARGRPGGGHEPRRGQGDAGPGRPGRGRVLDEPRGGGVRGGVPVGGEAHGGAGPGHGALRGEVSRDDGGPVERAVLATGHMALMHVRGTDDPPQLASVREHSVLALGLAFDLARRVEGEECLRVTLMAVSSLVEANGVALEPVVRAIAEQLPGLWERAGDSVPDSRLSAVGAPAPDHEDG